MSWPRTTLSQGVKLLGAAGHVEHGAESAGIVSMVGPSPSAPPSSLGTTGGGENEHAASHTISVARWSDGTGTAHYQSIAGTQQPVRQNSSSPQLPNSTSPGSQVACPAGHGDASGWSTQPGSGSWPRQ